MCVEGMCVEGVCVKGMCVCVCVCMSKSIPNVSVCQYVTLCVCTSCIGNKIKAYSQLKYCEQKLPSW